MFTMGFNTSLYLEYIFKDAVAASSEGMFLPLDKMNCRDKVDPIPPTLWTMCIYNLWLSNTYRAPSRKASKIYCPLPSSNCEHKCSQQTASFILSHLPNLVTKSTTHLVLELNKEKPIRQSTLRL